MERERERQAGSYIYQRYWARRYAGKAFSLLAELQRDPGKYSRNTRECGGGRRGGGGQTERKRKAVRLESTRPPFCTTVCRIRCSYTPFLLALLPESGSLVGWGRIKGHLFIPGSQLLSPLLNQYQIQPLRWEIRNTEEHLLQTPPRVLSL